MTFGVVDGASRLVGGILFLRCFWRVDGLFLCWLWVTWWGLLWRWVKAGLSGDHCNYVRCLLVFRYGLIGRGARALQNIDLFEAPCS